MSVFQVEPVDIESLPQEVKDRFPDIVQDLRDGVIEELPDTVIDNLPDSVVSRIPESLLASGVNTTFVIVLAAIAAVALLGFGYGITKAAIKAAMFFLVVGAIAGFILYTQY